MRKENELLVLKNEELRELLRRLREQLVAREKEAEKLRRRARLMQEDRVVLQDEVVSDREHVRKLEARIATMKDAAGLEARVLRYRQQAEDASRKCRQLADKLAVAEEDMGDKCREVKVLQAALRLHAAQMAPSGEEVV